MPNRKRYPKTVPETIHRVIEAYNQAAQVTRHGEPAPDWQLLSNALPHGSLTAITFPADKPGFVGLVIGERNPRYLEPEAALIVLALALFNPSAVIIDRNQTGGDELHYIEVGSSRHGRITLQRLLANASHEDTVRLTHDHHILCADALSIVPGKSRNMRGRKEASETALAAWKENAEKWGLASCISYRQYRDLIRRCFLLYDIMHGRHFLKPVTAAD